MNRYVAVGVSILIALLAGLPIYALLEPVRMEGARAALQEELVADGSEIYVDNCATCHGPNGEGVAAMPALNNPKLVGADHDILYETIAHAPHGTIMSAWHVNEGGSLGSYEVESLVSLVLAVDWDQVTALSMARGLTAPAISDPEVELATMEAAGENPHECQACHEEPAVHADRFGLNCSRCHTLQAWKPALLVRHTFLLDHGDQGKVSCQTCHTENYATNTCYECHDHDPADMQVVHAREEIGDFEACADCHPTGLSGEAASLGYGISGQQNTGPDEDSGRGDTALNRDAEAAPDAADLGSGSLRGGGGQ